MTDADQSQDTQTAPIVTLANAQGFPNVPESGDAVFSSVLAPLGAQLGLSKLGCMLTVVPPGKRAFPFHCHHHRDEMFVILEGSGTYRFGTTETPVKAGDICGAPAGRADTAHQLINTGTTDLRYLSIASNDDPDVCEYPDSGKFAFVSAGPGNDFATSWIRYVGRQEDCRDYWENEG